MTVETFTTESLANTYINGLNEPYYKLYDVEYIKVFTGNHIPPIDPMLTQYQLRDRFTQAEIDGITSFAYSGTGNAAARSILVFLQTAKDGIRKDDIRLTNALEFFRVNGILTTQRVSEILA